MNKIRLAQALVPIADELDERGLDEEASELDEIIQDLVSEAKIESGMQRESQANNPPLTGYNQLPSVSGGGSGSYGDDDYQKWYAKLTPEQKALVHKQFGNIWQASGMGEAKRAFDAYRGLAPEVKINDYSKIDAEIIKTRNRLLALQRQKNKMLYGPGAKLENTPLSYMYESDTIAPNQEQAQGVGNQTGRPDLY